MRFAHLHFFRWDRPNSFLQNQFLVNARSGAHLAAHPCPVRRWLRSRALCHRPRASRLNRMRLTSGRVRSLTVIMSVFTKWLAESCPTETDYPEHPGRDSGRSAARDEKFGAERLRWFRVSGACVRKPPVQEPAGSFGRKLPLGSGSVNGGFPVFASLNAKFRKRPVALEHLRPLISASVWTDQGLSVILSSSW